MFLAILIAANGAAADDKLELILTVDDEFEDFNLTFWKHELMLGGGGNWEFQAYANFQLTTDFKGDRRSETSIGC